VVPLFESKIASILTKSNKQQATNNNMTIDINFQFVFATRTTNREERDNLTTMVALETAAFNDLEFDHDCCSDIESYSDDSSIMDSDFVDFECTSFSSDVSGAELTMRSMVKYLRENPGSLSQDRIQELSNTAFDSANDSDDDIIEDNDSIVLARRNRGARQLDRKSQRQLSSSASMGADSLHLARNRVPVQQERDGGGGTHDFGEEDEFCEDSDYDSDYSVALKDSTMEYTLPLALPPTRTGCPRRPSSSRRQKRR
jgi:hypothetical protein